MLIVWEGNDLLMSQDEQMLYVKIEEILKHDEEFVDEMTKIIANKLVEKYSNYPLKDLLFDVNKDNITDFSNYEVVSNINEVLDKQGWTVAELVKRSCVPSSTLRGIINGTNTSLKNAFILSKVTGLPIEVLFSFVNTKK
jgi:predicted transcriptional regulator